MYNIKLLVADDHNLFRAGLIKILNELPNIIITGEAENGKMLIDKYFNLHPDIIITDISMPVLSGIKAVKRITQRDKNARALFLSMYDSEDYVYACLNAGGKGMISKNIGEGELYYAIEKIFEGERYFGSKLDDAALDGIILKYNNAHSTDIIQTGYNFTKREIEILEMLTQGLTSREMAEKMKLGKRTIDSYRSDLIKKLNLNSLPELIKFAIHYSFNKKPYNIKDDFPKGFGMSSL